MKECRIVISTYNSNQEKLLIEEVKNLLLEDENLIIKSGSIESRAGLTGTEIVISFIVSYSASIVANETPKAINFIKQKLNNYKNKTNRDFKIEDVSSINTDIEKLT